MQTFIKVRKFLLGACNCSDPSLRSAGVLPFLSEARSFIHHYELVASCDSEFSNVSERKVTQALLFCCSSYGVIRKATPLKPSSSTGFGIRSSYARLLARADAAYTSRFDAFDLQFGQPCFARAQRSLPTSRCSLDSKVSVSLAMAGKLSMEFAREYRRREEDRLAAQLARFGAHAGSV
eukprot:5667494-Pleurochrysis_carterae.AAC.1